MKFPVLRLETEICGQLLINFPIKSKYGKLRGAKDTFLGKSSPGEHHQQEELNF